MHHAARTRHHSDGASAFLGQRRAMPPLGQRQAADAAKGRRLLADEDGCKRFFIAIFHMLDDGAHRYFLQQRRACSVMPGIAEEISLCRQHSPAIRLSPSPSAIRRFSMIIIAEMMIVGRAGDDARCCDTSAGARLRLEAVAGLPYCRNAACGALISAGQQGADIASAIGFVALAPYRQYSHYRYHAAVGH